MPSSTELAVALGAALQRRGEFLATAESCTGGLVAKLMTDIAGSSAWFERGLVTYSNAAKQELLGVPAAVIEQHGAVSEPCAVAMVAGLLAHTPADCGIAITGIAGPGGGSEDKPVGTVWIAWAQRGAPPQARGFRFDGDRAAVREQSAAAAMSRLLEMLQDG